MAGAAVPFRVEVEDAVLADLRLRLEETRLPIAPEGAGWRYGSDLGYMRNLAEHWLERYDWRRWEAALNRFPQFRAAVGGLNIHYIIEQGSGARPLPLLLTHGWPGSVFEFDQIIEPLAHPERFGADAGDAFTVIAPSLPGYGFSDAPATPMAPRDIARLWHELMTQVLGFERFAAQAGDWGSVVTSWLAFDRPQSLAAIHLTMPGARPYTGEGAEPLDESETEWVAAMSRRLKAEGAYQEIQGSKPQSLAYGLTDSPLGLAAWIIEKFHGWSGGGADTPPPFDPDRLITNVMLYWLGGINAANWLYWSVRHGGRFTLGRGERIEVPTGFAFLPQDLMAMPPERWTRRAYNVVHRCEFPDGGHFAAMQKGPPLIEDVRQFFRRFRS